jgi:hypothetical protein
LETGDHGIDDGAEVDGATVERMAAGARQVQKVVNEKGHALGAFEKSIDKHAAFGIEALGCRVLEEEADVVDVLQRTTEIVGDGVGESFELFVRDGEFGGAFLYAQFELGA